MRAFVGGHLLTIGGGTLHYRRKDYPLAGASARVESTGWRGQKHELIIDGAGWQIAGRVPNKNARVAYAIAEAVNNAVRELTAQP